MQKKIQTITTNKSVLILIEFSILTNTVWFNQALVKSKLEHIDIYTARKMIVFENTQRFFFLANPNRQLIWS